MKVRVIYKNNLLILYIYYFILFLFFFLFNFQYPSTTFIIIIIIIIIVKSKFAHYVIVKRYKSPFIYSLKYLFYAHVWYYSLPDPSLIFI